MESLSRPPYRNRASSAILSKKLSKANSFSAANAYDDVFAGPPKFRAPTFSSRVEDFDEIFGGSQASRGSSIPILDLSALEETKVLADARSSKKLDYSKIFGGFRDEDIAVSYEEMFGEPKEAETFSEEARTPAKTVSPSKGSDHLNYQSSDGMKQFNMSYNKTSQRSNDGANGTTHVAQLHAVPGFTCFIVENNQQKTECDKSVPSLKRDINLDMDFTEGDKSVPSLKSDKLDMDFTEGIMEGKRYRKAKSHLTKKQTSEGVVKFRSKSSLDGFYSNNKLFDASEISPKTNPSKVSPLSSRLANSVSNKGNPKRSMSSNFELSKSDTSEGGAGDCSPPFFDEELDVNSAAAASAAALRKAIEKAQESIRIAKESMERKREGFRSFSKLSSKDSLDVKERRENKENKVAGEANRTKEKNAKGICERVDAVLQIFAGTERQNGMKSGKVAPEFKDNGEPFTAGKVVGETNGSKLESAEECEAARWFSEPVNTGKHRTETSAFVQADSKDNITQSVDTHECRSKEMKTTKEILEQQEGNHKEAVEQAHGLDDMRRKQNAVKISEEWDEHMNRLESAQEVHEQEENEKTGVAQEDEETEEKQKAFYEQEKCEKKLEESQEPIENEKFECQECKENDSEKRLDEAHEWVENEKKPQEVLEQEQNEKILKDDHKKEENENKLEKVCEQEEIERRLKEASEWLDYENKLKESCEGESNEGESNEKKQNDAHKGEDNEKRLKKVLELETNEKRLNDTHDGKETEKRLKEDCEWDEMEKRHTEAYECEETESIRRETDEGKDNEKIEVNHEAVKDEKNLDAAGDACKWDASESLSGTQEVRKHEEIDNSKETSQEVSACEENERILEVTKAFCEFKEAEKEPEAIKVAYELEKTEMCKTACLIKGAAEHIEVENKMKDAPEAFLFDDDLADGLTDIDFGQKQIDQNEKESELASNLGNGIEILEHESEENKREVKEVEIALDPEEDKNNFKTADEERQWVKMGKKMEASQPPSVFKGKEKMREIDQEINTSQNTEKNEENLNKTFAMEEKETKEPVQKQVKVEKELLQKIDEAYKREREREKDRIAVERAIREARERAFAEARERVERAAVERATAEARQRVMAEVREKSEKASAGIKSSAERASIEAKLRAERAAVERATAEARERALEKALSQKATFEAREEAERFVAERFPGAFRDNDPQKFDGTNGESAQRCKARLERHQRTMERAEKALAEKNMRDLLAQREQAERNRLAEALDADVKRWSNGKEGNLRALLSTLQYILGPNSGWQPISLTDIITTNAVKKAYRKATLYVHPDKLQQRGASIQQKYICEKVFDLLKAAWNKFTSEER